MSQNSQTTTPVKGKYKHIVLRSISAGIVLLGLVLGFMTLLEIPGWAWGWVGHVPSEEKRIITAFWIFAGILLGTFFEFIRIQVESVDLAERLRGMEGKFEAMKEAAANQLSEAKADMVTRFGDARTDMVEQFKTAKADIINQLDNTAECRYVGLGQKTVLQIMERLERAEEVKNTYVLFGVSENDAYAQKQFSQYHEGIVNFIKGGGSWSDIISQGVIISPSHGWLQIITNLYKEAGDSSKAKQTGDGSETKEASDSCESKAELDRYKIHRLKESYPIINFTIIRYKDDKREVLFGWGHHAEDPMGRVFVSRSEPLISSFEQYWHMLEKDSALIHPALGQMKMRSITPPEITGLWVRVSFYVDRFDRKAEHGVPPNAHMHDVALVKISIDDNRKLVVEGKRFNVDSKGCVSSEHGFEAKAVDIEQFSLWFATTSNSEERLHIAGWYEFIPDEEPIWNTNVRVRELYGEFVEYETDKLLEDNSNNPHTFNRKVGRLILYGTRVREEWIEKESRDGRTYMSEEYADDFPNAPDKQVALINKCLDWWRTEGEPRWRYGCGRVATAGEPAAAASETPPNESETKPAESETTPNESKTPPATPSA